MAIDETAAGGEFGGLFFSPLDQNLWHLTDTLENTPGHGFTALDADARPQRRGGGSLRFGFDPLNEDYNHRSQNNLVSNTLTAEDMQGFSGYNFIGGAHGNIQSNRLDLSGISSEDQPHLYFTYLLDTEGRDSGVDLNQQPMRDSLRVYVADQNGDWTLVATNNFDRSVSDPNFGFNPQNAEREYAPRNSGYGDTENNRRFVQELFDGDQFRQARVDLGPWAGQEDVRLRFEFSTAGESRPDQNEIFALPGAEIQSGHTLTLRGEMPDKVFTNIGDPLTVRSETFEFTFDDTASGTNVPVQIHASMTASQVAEALQQTIANEIRYRDAPADASGDFSVAGFPLSEGTADNVSVTVFDLTVSQANAGKQLRLIQGELAGGSNLPGSEFGLYQGGVNSLTELLRAGQRSKGFGGDNGVYLDDIVIGLAEWGESVGGYLSQPSPSSQLVSSPYFEPDYNGAVRPEISSGSINWNCAPPVNTAIRQSKPPRSWARYPVHWSPPTNGWQRD